ncbi:uncharacterized protein [Oryza sativa Japonica Group]
MLSALSKCSPIQLSTQANINKVLTCNTPLLIPSSLLNKKDSERMEDNMMYPIKDQETMLTNGHEQAAAGYSLLQGNFAAPNQYYTG